jgi:hypothetical protein
MVPSQPSEARTAAYPKPGTPHRPTEPRASRPAGARVGLLPQEADLALDFFTWRTLSERGWSGGEAIAVLSSALARRQPYSGDGLSRNVPAETTQTGDDPEQIEWRYQSRRSRYGRSAEPVICQPSLTRVRLTCLRRRPLRRTTVARFPWTVAATAFGTESKTCGSELRLTRRKTTLSATAHGFPPSPDARTIACASAGETSPHAVLASRRFNAS